MDARELELLVARLETVLAEYPLRITSPDFLPGRLSHTDREVDVSIRGALGTVELLVIIECRHRSRAEDVQWIEQLATKREDVGADKAVAVSSKGFSSAAYAVAHAKGIDLRVISDLSIQDVESWLRLSVLHVHVWNWALQRIDLKVFEAPSPLGGDPELVHTGGFEHLPLRSLATGATHRLGEIVEAGLDSLDRDSVSDQPSRLGLVLSRADDPLFEVETRRGWQRVGDLSVVLEMSDEEYEAPVTAVRRYTTATGRMADVVEMETQIGNMSHRVSFVHGQSGLHVTVESWEGEPDAPRC